MMTSMKQEEVEEKVRQANESLPPKPVDLHELSLGGLDFSRQDLAGGFFDGTHLEDTKWQEAKVMGAHFFEAHLDRAMLSTVEASRADFGFASLRGSDAFNARFDAADFEEADLRGVNFSGADLSGANLKNADCRGADFTGANLSGANCTGANFKKTTLVGCSVHQTLFERTIFGETDLSGVDMKTAFMTDAEKMADVYSISNVWIGGKRETVTYLPTKDSVRAGRWAGSLQVFEEYGRNHADQNSSRQILGAVAFFRSTKDS